VTSHSSEGKNSTAENVATAVGSGSSNSIAAKEGLGKPAWLQYLFAAAAVAVATLINLGLHDWMGHQAIAVVYLLCVVLIALVVGRGAIFFGTFLSAVGWSFMHAPPRFSFQIAGFYDKIMLATYFVVALTVGQLTTQLRRERARERRREAVASALYNFTRDLAGASSMDELCRLGVRNLKSLFDAEIAAFLPPEGNLSTQSLVAHPASSWTPAPQEREAARAELELPNKQTLRDKPRRDLFLNLDLGESGKGLLAFRFKRPPLSWIGNLAVDFSGQFALAIERHLMRKAELSHKILSESERMSRALLNSISHELRTPIATIIGAASALNATGQLPASHLELTSEILTASDRLNRVVQSLLSAARLQAGQLRPKLEWCDVSDLVNVSLKGVEKSLRQHPVSLNLPSSLPLVNADFVLMEQVIANLLLNVATHTPEGTQIFIQASEADGSLILEIADNGPGLVAADLDRVFELFYRAANAKPGGTGLGLAIVRGFIEAQGGTVAAANQASGGAMFSIRLPCRPKPALIQEDL